MTVHTDQWRLVDLVPAPIRLAKRALQDWARSEPELRLLRDLCPRGCVALDIGANYGVYSWHLSRIAGRVVAFEPQHAMAEFIRSALRSRVQVEEVALSDRTGEALLRIPGDRFLDGCATIEEENGLGAQEARAVAVPVRRLDDMGFSGVGFIKLDVEGHELAVLRGARELLQRERPTLLVEAEERHRPNAYASVRDFLSVFGYEGTFLSQGQLRPVGDGNSWSAGDTRPYNFVFRPR